MRYDIFAYDDNNVFGIYSIGYSADINVTHFGPAQRDLYIIHYIISGKGYFNGCKVNKGQGFLITPGMSEHYYPDPENPWSFFWVIFSSPIAEKFFEKYNADSKTLIFEYRNTYAVTDAVNRLVSAKRSLYASSELMEIFLHVFNSPEHIQKENEKAADTYYHYAVSYINTNLFRSITVDNLTEILGITQPYLYNIFISKCDISPKKYIISRKLSKAKQLLSETDMPISEIAASVGYSDALNFSKMFKKNTGYSPKAFREIVLNSL